MSRSTGRVLRIVFGLGNPGRRYEATRHNLGFRVVDYFARRSGGTPVHRISPRLLWVAEVPVAGEPVVLAKPMTFMNDCGRAAVAVCTRYHAEPTSLVAVYDDADLALGRIRIRPHGSAGGHNGVRSMISALGTEAFPRVRLGVRGVGRTEQDLADYVLDGFEPDERPLAAGLVVLGADAVQTLLRDGLEAAMRAFNGRSVIEDEGGGRTV